MKTNNERRAFVLRSRSYLSWKPARTIWNAGKRFLVPATLLLAGDFTANVLAQTTVTFQQGANGYTSALDTRLITNNSTIQSTDTKLRIDGGASSYGDGSFTQGLIWFDGLFGDFSTQIPTHATITAATLTLKTGSDSGANDQSTNSFGAYRLLSGFDANSTWTNSYGNDGVTLGVDASAIADSVQVGGQINVPVAFDVLGSINYWKSQATPNSSNFGWLINTIDPGTNLWAVWSSDAATVADRPILSVTYLIPDNLTWNAANLSGVWEAGNSANQVWTDNATTLAASYDDTDNAIFSQNPASPVSIAVNGSVTPSTMAVSHTAGSYEFSGGSINTILTKTGEGTVVFNSANGFLSSNLSGGVVEVNAANALGTAGTVALDGGITLHSTVTTFNDPALGFTFNNQSTIEVDTGTSYQIYGVTGGLGTLNKTGAGALEFYGTSGFNGAIDIQGGSVLLADPFGTGGDLGVSSITVQNGATFQFGSAIPAAEENPDLPNDTNIAINAGGTATFTVGEQYGGITLNGGTLNNTLANPTQSSSWVNLTPSILMSGAINGGAGLTIGAAHTANKTTPDTVTVTGTPITVSGTLNIQQGTFSTDADLLGNGSMTIGTATDNATLQLRASAPVTYGKAFSIGDAGATVDVSEPSGNVTWNGVISGATGSLAKTGPGTLTLAGLNSMTGAIEVQGGVLNVNGLNNGGQSGPLGASSSNAANLILNGGALQYSGGSVSSDRGFSLGSSGGAIDVVNPGANVTLSGNAAGSGNFTKTGSGTLVLSGTNQYSGTTTVAGGNLSVSPFAASGGFTIADGTTLTTRVPTLSSSLTMPTLTMGAAGASLNFEMVTSGVPTSSLMNVTSVDGINLNSATQTINVLTANPLSVGTYRLIDYAGSPITSGFAIGTIGGRAAANLIYNTIDTRIDLQVASTDSIRWKGDLSSD